MIYLDNAATTEVDSFVARAMESYTMFNYGNAGSIHSFGRKASEAIEEARERVAGMLHCSPENIVFTSGASEGNSMVFSGLESYLKNNNRFHIAVSSVEHSSVIRSAEGMTRRRFFLSFIAPEADGTVTARSVLSSIHLSEFTKTGLVSVMHTNNELGSVNDIKKISKLCHNQGILFHTDITQAAGYDDINVVDLDVDFATLSAHKFHGPKGVGAIYIKDMSIMDPLIFGGIAQEHGLRGGTENVTGIVGMGRACAVCHTKKLLGTDCTFENLRIRFFESLLAALDCNSLEEAGIHVNGPKYSKGKIINLRVDGVLGETLVLAADARGVMISAGSACSARNMRPSHVLTAIGLSPDEARNSVRISFSYMTTGDDVEQGGRIIGECINSLRAMTAHD